MKGGNIGMAQNTKWEHNSSYFLQGANLVAWVNQKCRSLHYGLVFTVVLIVCSWVA